MKTTLRVVPHSTILGARVFEVLYDGQVIATVVGADGAGVRIFSKHTLSVEQESEAAPTSTGKLNVCEVRIGAG
jgi:hypothetical protein